MMLRVVILFQLLSCSTACAQQFPGEDKWKMLLDHEGLTFRYLYHRKADSRNAGVVLMLENTNSYAVTYAFKVVFSSTEGKEAVYAVSGEMAAGQRKAGSNDGLFWVPWSDQRVMATVGLRGYKVHRKKERRNPWPR